MHHQPICAPVARFSPLNLPPDCLSGDLLSDAWANWVVSCHLSQFSPTLRISFWKYDSPAKVANPVKVTCMDPLGGDLSLVSLAVHHDVKDKAAICPAGVVEPSYDLRKAMLMSCTYPSPQPSIIHPSIYLLPLPCVSTSARLPIRMSMQTRSAISAPGLRAALIT